MIVELFTSDMDPVAKSDIGEHKAAPELVIWHDRVFDLITVRFGENNVGVYREKQSCTVRYIKGDVVEATA